jgi:predicted transcriptional regulator
MPAPKGNTNAAKPAREKAGERISIRMTKELRARVEKAAEKRDMKPSPWIVEAAEEKCDRESATKKGGRVRRK